MAEQKKGSPDESELPPLPIQQLPGFPEIEREEPITEPASQKIPKPEQPVVAAEPLVEISAEPKPISKPPVFPSRKPGEVQGSRPEEGIEARMQTGGLEAKDRPEDEKALGREAAERAKRTIFGGPDPTGKAAESWKGPAEGSIQQAEGTSQLGRNRAESIDRGDNLGPAE